jgi:hypothetical protein
MATAITTYCTADNVRATLGVSVDEIDDSVVMDKNNATRLAERMNELSPDLAAYYLTLKALGSPTANQTRMIDLVESFASYIVAQRIAETGAISIPKSIEDSKAKMERNTDFYKDLLTNLLNSIAYISSKISSLYLILVPGGTVVASVVPVYMVTSPISFDPVTNQ